MVCGSIMMVTSYGLDNRDLIPARGRYFPVCQNLKAGSGGYPFSYLMYSRGIKAVECESNQSNAWSYTSIPPYLFMA
jgi:hypothetical protein